MSGMWRVLRAGMIVAALALAAVWLANVPGDVTARWRGYELQTSVVFVLLAGLVAGCVVAVVWRGIQWVYRGPRRVRERLELRRARRDGVVLSRALAAIDAGDSLMLRRQQAQLSAGMRRVLGNWLAASAARLEGSVQEVACRAMLATPLESVGLRGLCDLERSRGESDAALQWARRAMQGAGRPQWAFWAVIELESARGKWEAAVATAAAGMKARRIPAARGRRLQAALLTAWGGDLEQAAEQALGDRRREIFRQVARHAGEAVRLREGFVPAVCLAARAAARQGESRRAMSLIEAAWRREPHPDLSAAWVQAAGESSGADHVAHLTRLTRLRRDHLECALLAAQAAVVAGGWQEARRVLAFWALPPPAVVSARVCRMMARIEEGAFPAGSAGADGGMARAWLDRAIDAPTAGGWVSGGGVLAHWRAVCPWSGAVDAMVWQPEISGVSAPDLVGQKPPAGESPSASAPPGPSAPPPVQPPVQPDDPGLLEKNSASSGAIVSLRRGKKSAASPGIR